MKQIDTNKKISIGINDINANFAEVAEKLPQGKALIEFIPSQYEFTISRAAYSDTDKPKLQIHVTGLSDAEIANNFNLEFQTFDGEIVSCQNLGNPVVDGNIDAELMIDLENGKLGTTIIFVKNMMTQGISTQFKVTVTE